MLASQIFIFLKLFIFLNWDLVVFFVIEDLLEDTQLYERYYSGKAIDKGGFRGVISGFLEYG